ncbi:MAG: zinc ribbon domain-containing protein [Clostridia bacterium]|nr:zinc ribbon domain-containing protein [Clostridia bacterium]
MIYYGHADACIHLMRRINMFCKNCGNELTGSEVFCPKCGFQNAAQAETEQAQPDFSAQQSGTCPVCGNPVNPTATFCTTCGATLNGAADSSMNNSMNNGTNYGSDFGYSEPPKKKRKKAPFIIGGAAAVVLIAGGICIANAASLGNFIKRTFSSPESYY